MARPRKIPSTGQFVAQMLLTSVFIPAFVLFLAGNWRWLEGWIFALWFDAMLMFNGFYLYFKDPALLAERSKAPGSDNQKSWDKYLVIVIYLMALLWFVILPLDAERFRWSPRFPLWVKTAGGVALLPAIYLIERATIENTYLSTLVRIQSDRKQHVISSGTYAFVRHPLYLGCVLMMAGAPLLMGSLYGLAITLVGIVILAGRILGEEQMLTEELEGYAEYKKQVSYRLIPFIW